MAARTATYYGESDDRVTRQATSDRQQDLNVTTLVHACNELLALLKSENYVVHYAARKCCTYIVIGEAKIMKLSLGV